MQPYYETSLGQLYHGDCLETLRELPDESVNCCVTSPPYWGLRDYGAEGQIGLEKTPEEYVSKIVEIFREVRRVLRNDGTLWLNIGDSFAANRGSGAKSIGKKQATNIGANLGKLTVPVGLKPKDLIGTPWMVAFALRADGWYLRQDIIWHKPNPMPESVTDRCTKAHEYIFLMSKAERYFYDAEAIKENAGWNPNNTKKPDGWDTGRGSHGTFHRLGREKGAKVLVHKESRKTSIDKYPSKRNKRSVWTIPTKPFPEAHFATFPPALIEPCILAGCPFGGAVLDPFFGAGTSGFVAERFGRQWVGIELNKQYCEIAAKRIEAEAAQLKLFA